MSGEIPTIAVPTLSAGDAILAAMRELQIAHLGYEPNKNAEGSDDLFWRVRTSAEKLAALLRAQGIDPRAIVEMI